LDSVLNLQRTVGNRAVLWLLQPTTEDLDVSSAHDASLEPIHDLSRAAARAGSLSNVQAKLEVNASLKRR